MGRNAALTKLAKIVEQTEADERNELNRVCLKASDGSGDLNELSRAIKGRLGELLVAMDLMKRGFEVFEHITERTSCDMLALRRGTSHILRVEVKYIGVRTDGRRILRYYSSRGFFDVLAAVSPDSSIAYFDSRGNRLAEAWNSTSKRDEENPSGESSSARFPESGDSRLGCENEQENCLNRAVIGRSSSEEPTDVFSVQ